MTNQDRDTIEEGRFDWLMDRMFEAAGAVKTDGFCGEAIPWPPVTYGLASSDWDWAALELLRRARQGLTDYVRHPSECESAVRYLGMLEELLQSPTPRAQLVHD